MVNFILLLLGIFSLVLQLSAALLVYRIYKFNRLSPWWLILLSAFELEAIRRIFDVYSDMTLQVVPLDLFANRILLYTISLFINFGLWSMLKNFEKFDFIKEKVGRKAREFKK